MSQHPQHVTIRIKLLPHGEGLALPRYQTPQAAGVDLSAAVAHDAPIVLKPGQHSLVPTGLAIALPDGFEGQVRPRSGLALNHGITVLNAPGTIDADYRGEVKIVLINLGGKAFSVERGQRIAQMIVAPVVQAGIEVVTELEATKRGIGGFGSTGEKT